MKNFGSILRQAAAGAGAVLLTLSALPAAAGVVLGTSSTNTVVATGAEVETLTSTVDAIESWALGNGEAAIVVENMGKTNATVAITHLGTNAWSSAQSESNAVTRANAYTDEAVDALDSLKADRAWSAHYSGSGADAPANTTWVSTPTLVIAGGLEYAKTITSGGEVWVLSSNGMVADVNASSNSFIKIDASGETVLWIERVGSAAIPVDIASISVSGNAVTVPLSGTYPVHPVWRITDDLRNAWYLEEDYPSGTIPGIATVSWSNTSPLVCTVTNISGGDRIFVTFYAESEPYTVIHNNGLVDISQGFRLNGTNFLPRVTSGVLTFHAQ